MHFISFTVCICYGIESVNEMKCVKVKELRNLSGYAKHLSKSKSCFCCYGIMDFIL